MNGSAEGSPAGAGVVDFHNHLIPGVDDGASDIEQSRAALRALVEAGVRRVVVTPHLSGADTLRAEALATRLAELDAGWAKLKQVADAEFAQLEVHRGVECMLDVPEPDLSDPRVRLGGGKFVLVEFPFLSVPPRSADALRTVQRHDYVPIVAHPERYAGVTPDLAIVGSWREAGGLLAVNGASLVGRYGGEAQRLAWALLERGWADYLCSDYHARGQTMITAYRSAVEEAAGRETVQLLTQVNPGRMLDGERPLPVPPVVTRKSLWTRLTRSILGRGATPRR